MVYAEAGMVVTQAIGNAKKQQRTMPEAGFFCRKIGL